MAAETNAWHLLNSAIMSDLRFAGRRTLGQYSASLLHAADRAGNDNAQQEGKKENQGQ